MSHVNNCVAYFEVSLDASLGILNRPWFEQQLAAHLAGTLDDRDSTWYAIRNVVFAAGCRIEMCKSQSFQEAAEHAWGYFENALSVYARLLFFKTSITGVQTLTLMVSLSEVCGTLAVVDCANIYSHTIRRILECHAWSICCLLMLSG
jgi:hypothetical protein